MNTKDEINSIEETILENLRELESAPGIYMHEIPDEFLYDPV